MIDPIKCEDIARIVSGEVIGDPNLLIKGFNRIEHVREGELTFLSDNKFEPLLDACKATCILVYRGLNAKPNENQAFIVVDNPYEKLSLLFRTIAKDIEAPSCFVHPSAVVEESAQLHDSVYIGANCYVGRNVFLGENVILHANAVVQQNCKIGGGTEINSNVSIYKDTIVGSNCLIHSGAVVGSDGFGYLEKEDGSFEKIPQLGNVVIGDDVEIGSNSTIDRALLGSTIIGNGVKIDNLVHIAHNCEIGDNTALAGQAGVSGSVKIGLRNRLGGQVGLSGHIFTGNDVIIMAKSGVSKSIPEKGIYQGAPAKDKMKQFRIEAALRNLPDIVKEFSKIKKQLGKEDQK